MDGNSYAAPHVSGLAHILAAMGTPRHVSQETIVRSATRFAVCLREADLTCTGKINGYRAVKSTLYNGIFEAWLDGSNAPPTAWHQAGNCADQVVNRSGQNATKGQGAIEGEDAAFSLRTRCDSQAGYTAVYKEREVTPGWTYRFTVKTRLTAGGSQPAPPSVRICYLDGETNQLPASCTNHEPPTLGETWQAWEFETAAPAPAQAEYARVELRTRAGGTGAVLWDDEGFYADLSPVLEPPPSPLDQEQG